MTDVTTIIGCNKVGCEVLKTGLCADGHNPRESCPFFGGATASGTSDSENLDLDVHQHDSKEEWVDLPSGEALDLAGADEFLRCRPITLVTIVGERESGKTTLICAIYDRFLHGPFAQCQFAESRTLSGFERRSHDSRADSGRTVPDTPRTSHLDGLQFFHLGFLRLDRAGERVDLMLSDRAGETYRQARSRSDIVPDLVEVSKAGTAVLLLDGGRVATRAQRAGAFQAVRQTLRAFLDGGALGLWSRVQIVTTKIDIWFDQMDPDRQEMEAALSEFRERLRIDFAYRLKDLSFWGIAARDPSGRLQAAHGVDALFTSWLVGTSGRTEAIDRSMPILRSEFDRLLLRTAFESLP